MTVGALLFWIFIGLPIVGVILRFVLVAVFLPFFAVGSGMKHAQGKREERIAQEIRRLDAAERAQKTQSSQGRL